MNGPLRVDLDHRPDAVIVHLDGEIDLANAAMLRAQMLEQAPGADCLVVDLGEVAYMDSAGIEMLFQLYAALEDGEQTLITVAPEGTPAHRLLQLAAVGDVGTVCRTVADALSSCSVSGAG